MRFTVNRTSHSAEDTKLGLLPCEDAVWQHVRNVRGEVRLSPVVYLATIDDVVNLAVNNGGRVVVSGPAELEELPHIEIYDDWRE